MESFRNHFRGSLTLQSNHRLKSLALVGVQLAAAGFIVHTGQVMVCGLVLQMLLAASLALGLWALFPVKLTNLRIAPDVAPRAELNTNGPFRFIHRRLYSALPLATLALTLNISPPPDFLPGSFCLLTFCLNFRMKKNCCPVISKSTSHTGSVRNVSSILSYKNVICG